MKHIKLYILIIFVSISINTYSQKTVFPSFSYKPDKAYFKSYLTASKEIAISPINWTSKQWVIAGSVAATGIIIYTFDNEIRQFFQNNKSNAADAASKYFFEPYGRGIYPAMIIGGFYVYGLSTDDKHARQVALGATQAFIMSALTVQIVKTIAHRHRPYQDDLPNSKLWEGPFKGFKYNSFPSGHTIAAFTMASFFSAEYSDKLWVGIVSYGIATGVGLSRVYDDKHWASDVFIGAALGVAIGQMVHRIISKESNLSMGVSDTGGLSLVYRLE